MYVIYVCVYVVGYLNIKELLLFLSLLLLLLRRHRESVKKTFD